MRFVGRMKEEIPLEDIFSDGDCVLLDSDAGLCFIKRIDYDARKVDTPVIVYPVTEEVIKNKVVRPRAVVLDERDYQRTTSLAEVYKLLARKKVTPDERIGYV